MVTKMEHTLVARLLLLNSICTNEDANITPAQSLFKYSLPIKRSQHSLGPLLGKFLQQSFHGSMLFASNSGIHIHGRIALSEISALLQMALLLFCSSLLALLQLSLCKIEVARYNIQLLCLKSLYDFGESHIFKLFDSGPPVRL